MHLIDLFKMYHFWEKIGKMYLAWWDTTILSKDETPSKIFHKSYQ